MTTNDLIQKMILGEITLSQGLMLCKVMYKGVLSDEDYQWISNELDYYEEPETIPDYRIIDCSVKAIISVPYLGTKIEELDISSFKRIQEESKKPYAFPNKMLVRQGIESIEHSLLDAGQFAHMELNQGQIDLLLKYYRYPSGCRIEKIYQECNMDQLRNIVPCVRNKLINILLTMTHNSSQEKKPQGNGVRKKTVFISYSWDNDDHRAWVKSLADRLSETFEVKIDFREPLGIDFSSFMEQVVCSSDRVLLILTPNYKAKADASEKGVGYESVLIRKELYNNQNSNKFVPIIRIGGVDESYPLYLGTRKGLDMRNDDLFEEKLAELVKDIEEH